MTEIEKAEKALATAKLKQANKIKNSEKAVNKHCIGRIYKYKYTFNNTYSIKYCKVLDFMRYSDGKLMFGESSSLISENVDVTFGIKGYLIRHGELRYLGAYTDVRLPLKKHFTKDTAINPTQRHHFSYFRPKELRKDNSIKDDNNNIWEECSEEEFQDVRRKVLAANDVAHKDFYKYTAKSNYISDVVDIKPSDITILKELVNKIDDKSINLKDYLRIAKQTTDFVTFNNSLLLDELIQYSIRGEKGLELSIDGTDGGTEYEPYVTGYEVTYVHIDWLKVLYTIRISLDSIKDTAEELTQLVAVYATDNWQVNYSGSYDVSFSSAVLDKKQVNAINEVIKKHLK